MEAMLLLESSASSVQVRILPPVPMNLVEIETAIKEREKLENKGEWQLNPIGCLWEDLLDYGIVDDSLREWMIDRMLSPQFDPVKLSHLEFILFKHILEENVLVAQPGRATA